MVRVGAGFKPAPTSNHPGSWLYRLFHIGVFVVVANISTPANLGPPFGAVTASVPASALAAASSTANSAASSTANSAASSTAITATSSTAITATSSTSISAASTSGTFTYQLIDTYAKEPWHQTAGRFGHAADIAAAPDGTIYILDKRQAVIQVLNADGTPRSTLTVPSDGRSATWQNWRIDVGNDGDLWVLSRRPIFGFASTSRIDILSPEGARRTFFETTTAYSDLAVGPEGLVYLCTAKTPGHVDVYDRNEQLVETFGEGHLNVPVALDVDAGRGVYVLDRNPIEAGQPRPAPSPPPSRANASAWSREDASAARSEGELSAARSDTAPKAVRMDEKPFGAPVAQPTDPPAPERPEGVAIFDAARGFKERVALNGGDDIAVGGGEAGTQAYVSAGLEIFRLGVAAPYFTLPYREGVSTLDGGVSYYVEVDRGGRLLASLWHCYFQGLARFDAPLVSAVPVFVGGMDAPELEGPVYPQRVAADAGLAVLQGRFAVESPGPFRTYHPAPIAPQSEPQSVQWWPTGAASTGGIDSAGGAGRAPAFQMGVCAGHPEVGEVWWARDVAVDDRDVYTVDTQVVQRRTGDGFPAWTVWTRGLIDPDIPSRLQAVSARDERVAVLDVAARRVAVLDRDGMLIGSWSTADLAPVGADQSDGIVTDLAIGIERVFLADESQGRVWARGLDGHALADWPVVEGIRALAAGPGGELYVLTRHDSVVRYSADGTLEAHWVLPVEAELPDGGTDGPFTGPRVGADHRWLPLDIAAGRDGHVYVSFWHHEALDRPVGGATESITGAGVWVFGAQPSTVVPSLPSPAGCAVMPDKTASPAQVTLGDAVTVTLTLTGTCPARPEPLQVALVFDTSRSMNAKDALPRAQEAVLALLAQLDPATTEVSVVRFADGASLQQPLARSFGSAGAWVATVDAVGDTRLADGIEVALTELTGPRRNPAARQVMVLVTDGGYKDDPISAAGRAVAAGIDLYALVFRSEEFPGMSAVARVVGRADRILLDPQPEDVRRWADSALVVRGVESGLFGSAIVRDVIPENMTVVPGSLVPGGSVADRVITWPLGPVAAADGVRLAYRLVPRQVGRWPTNVEAAADYVDGFGGAGRAVFPVPEVDVVRTNGGAGRVWLPFLDRLGRGE